MKSALVVLADGTYFEGEGFGHEGVAFGEVVFNTSMSGYQEILTDPSYRGQLVTMTSPHIGNYGCNPLDVESDRVQVAGLIVRSASRRASNYRATETLDAYLRRYGTPGITGVDTRALTRRIRDAGAVMGCVAVGVTVADVPRLVAEIAAAPAYGVEDYVAACSVTSPRRVRLTPTGDRYAPHAVELVATTDAWDDPTLPHVVVLDFGVKRSILKGLARTMRVTVLPHNATAADVAAEQPDGVLFSNGPGDPGTMDASVAVLREVIGTVPSFGICLGHQLACRALGASTYKLKFGHRGPNQPVKDRQTGRVQITAQNHGYAVAPEGLPVDATVTHHNLNDGTIEGIAVPSLRFFSVQHHPEAGPGPHDADVMFAQFHEAVLAG